MRWRIPGYGECQIDKSFAWFPVKGQSFWIWLEPVWIVYRVGIFNRWEVWGIYESKQDAEQAIASL